jgi:prepilin-type N-terminal cleavage/methylation domain-containing protein
MRAREIRCNETGFTLVEVMVAIVLLTVGVLGTMSLVDNANGRTSDTKGREGATGLARDLIESTRGVPFNNVNTTDLAGRLQSQTGLADADPAAAGWQIKRRNFTYTVTFTACTVDDASDKLGTAASHDSTFCSGTGSASTADSDRNPYDFKRVKYTLSWSDQRGPQTVSQAALLNSTYRGPAASTITAGPVSNDKIALTVTFSSIAQSAKWYLDGRYQGTISGSPATTWTWNWDLGAGCVQNNPASVQDGVYTIGAVGYDGNGATGGPKSASVTVNRCPAYKPTGLAGGRNWGGVELTWAPNQETDVVGYDVFRGTTLVCSTDSVSATTCRDTPPDPAATYTYTVQAYDTGAAGRRASPASDPITVVPDCSTGAGTCNTPPITPDVSMTGGVLSISSKAPHDKDTGDGVQFFRVYRTTSASPPTTWKDRYDIVDNTASTVTWTDKAPGSYHYWVTAVDKHYTESDFAEVLP